MVAFREDVFIRTNGDRVAFGEYGDASGEPVIFCHGWPSSRMMAELTEDAARELRVRVISPDRPGIGESTFVQRRKLLDWPPLVSELADSLRIEEFRMLAISGGAAYAYATAWAIPERVSAIAVISGVPHIAELDDQSGLLALYRWLLRAHAKLPRGLSRLGFRAARPWLSWRPPRRSHAMPNHYETSARLKLVLRVSGAPGKIRPKACWRTRRFTRSRGDLPCAISVSRCDYGTGGMIAASRLSSRKQQRRRFRTVVYVCSKTRATILLPSGICAKFSRI
jgi:pimeloyl-ACP methyl ester carboxylesterase